MKKGILFIILSGLSFTVVNFFVKLLGNPDSSVLGENLQSYPAHELVLARSIVSFTISLFIIKRRKMPVWGNNKRWLFIRGIAGTIALTLFFYSIHHLPLAVASTVQYLAPIFTVLFAIWLLNERVNFHQWFFILLSFIGVALIASGRFIAPTESNEQFSYLWFGLGMVSSAFSGIAYVAIMKLKNTDEPITIVMYFPMIAGPIMIVLCLFDFTMPQGIEWLYLLIIGIFTQMAQILLTRALHIGNASTITPFQYLGAIYAFLIGLYAFNEHLSWIINLGILITVSGVVINAVLKRR